MNCCRKYRNNQQGDNVSLFSTFPNFIMVKTNEFKELTEKVI